MDRKFMLDGDWSLIYVENKRLRTEEPDYSTISALEGTGYNKIPARVPGNFERDLFKAGLIEDPYFASNSIELQRLEKYHMFYYRTFELYEKSSKEMMLHFEGIDTAAEIFLNGKLIAEVENMLIPHVFNVYDQLNVGKNEIIVHIIPACIASRKYPMDAATRASDVRASGVYMRKAPHMFGWDIMPRLVSGGIWRSVWIEALKESRIDDVYMFASLVNPQYKVAYLDINANMTLGEDDSRDYDLEITGTCVDSVFNFKKDRLWHNSITSQIKIENAKLWWPRNYGDPNVYDVVAKLKYKGEVVDEYKTRIGIRMAALERTDVTDANGSGEFVFRVNGKKIFAMGTNWVPADAMHSFDEERIPEILPMIDDLGCTIIRLWGGNVYESQKVYDFCDDHGIMIWQDFIMGCNLYPQDEDFKARLAMEASIAVKRLRNHPSIVLWAGDNECDEVYFWSVKHPNLLPSNNALTRKVLPNVLKVHDPSRPFLPSSPYLCDEIAKNGNRFTASELHLWGPRDYFKSDFYGKSVCHLASETGYHASPSPDSIKRFISPEQVWPWTNDPRPPKGVHWDRMATFANPDWQTHATACTNDNTSGDRFRISLMANQVITLFGSEPEDLETFAYQSQISQAEAKKYFVERFRVTKWRRSGIIWWNLIDGWPQFSDAIVDYYGTKKIAYHYVKRSQAPLCFIFAEPEGDQLPLYVVNDLQEDKKVHFKVTDLTDGSVLIDSTVTAKADVVTHVWNKDMMGGEKRFYLIEWEYDGVKGKNHYFTNIRDIDYGYYKSCMEKAGYWEEFEGFGDAHPKKRPDLPYVFEK